MAKKDSGLCAPGYATRVYLDFKDQEEAEEFLAVGVGSKVYVALSGKLSSVRIDADGSASISIEDPEVERLDADTFSQLADDD